MTGCHYRGMCPSCSKRVFLRAIGEHAKCPVCGDSLEGMELVKMVCESQCDTCAEIDADEDSRPARNWSRTTMIDAFNVIAYTLQDVVMPANPGEHVASIMRKLRESSKDDDDGC